MINITFTLSLFILFFYCLQSDNWPTKANNDKLIGRKMQVIFYLLYSSAARGPSEFCKLLNDSLKGNRFQILVTPIFKSPKPKPYSG